MRNRTSSTDCIEWQGTRDQDGYGLTYIPATTNHHRRTARVHRHTWEQEHGPIPEGMLVLHHCDNPPCHNINHLFLGTHQDNVLDMQAKGRRGIKGGRAERHGLHKLTWADVEIIRSSTAATTDLARRFNVHPTCIWKVRTYRTWRTS